MTALRQAIRDLDRIRGENRALKERVALYERADLAGSQLVGYLRAYADLLLASDPLKGRPTESSSPAHPFDRPLPYLALSRVSAVLDSHERALRRMRAQAQQALEEDSPPPSRDACPACGGQVDRTGRPPNRRAMAALFLQVNLQGGQPQREEAIRAAAQQLGISRQTLRRAADQLRVRRYAEEHEWWWQL